MESKNFRKELANSLRNIRKTKESEGETIKNTRKKVAQEVLEDFKNGESYKQAGFDKKMSSEESLETIINSFLKKNGKWDTENIIMFINSDRFDYFLNQIQIKDSGKLVKILKNIPEDLFEKINMESFISSLIRREKKIDRFNIVSDFWTDGGTRVKILNTLLKENKIDLAMQFTELLRDTVYNDGGVALIRSEAVYKIFEYQRKTGDLESMKNVINNLAFTGLEDVVTNNSGMTEENKYKTLISNEFLKKVEQLCLNTDIIDSFFLPLMENEMGYGVVFVFGHKDKGPTGASFTVSYIESSINKNKWIPNVLRTKLEKRLSLFILNKLLERNKITKELFDYLNKYYTNSKSI